MSCNYRIIRYKNHHRALSAEHGAGYGLHEAYYDKDGKLLGTSVSAVGFYCSIEEGKEGIEHSLRMALADVENRPVLDSNEIPEEDLLGAAAIRALKEQPTSM